MFEGLETISRLSLTLVTRMWGCYANRRHSWSCSGEDNEAAFQRAVIKFRQKEVTKRTEKVTRHFDSQFDFDLKNRDLYCQLDCVVCFSLRGTVITVYSILGSSTLVLFAFRLNKKNSANVLVKSPYCHILREMSPHLQQLAAAAAAAL